MLPTSQASLAKGKDSLMKQALAAAASASEGGLGGLGGLSEMQALEESSGALVNQVLSLRMILIS